MINFMSFFSATHGEAILEVGRRIKSRLDIRKVDIVFENHQDTQNKHGSRGKATYYLWNPCVIEAILEKTTNPQLSV